MRVGVIRNPRSHRNRTRPPTDLPPDVILASPTTQEALETALAQMADAGVVLLIIDGGDGTVRDVLGKAFAAFSGRPPLLALIPHGKTNALARDLAIPVHWSVQAAIASAQLADRRAIRPVLHVDRTDEPGLPLTGFVFGVGAYVEATRLATRAHRLGVIDGFAVGVALVGSILGAFSGRRFAADEPVRIDGEQVASDRFLILASTLERFPLGLRPFGRPRPGLKLLDVDGQPRRLALALTAILTGREPAWLERAGYRRRTIERMSVLGAKSFVLDGEIYVGGDLTVRKGPDITFVTP